MSIELKEAEYALKNKMLIRRKAWQDFGCNIKLHESETLAPYPPVSEGFQTGPCLAGHPSVDAAQGAVALLSCKLQILMR